MVTVPTSAAITAFAGVVTAFGDWQPVRAEALARLAGAAVLTLLGQTNLSRTSQQTGQRRCRRRPSGLTLYTGARQLGGSGLLPSPADHPAHARALGRGGAPLHGRDHRPCARPRSATREEGLL
jgi:hypothetical protein